MFESIKGDLLLALDKQEVDYIIHQCNCFNSFGKGIAFSIKQKYPKAYLADQATIRGDKNKLGNFTKGSNVYNVYGQYTYGYNPVETIYDKLEEGLVKVLEDIVTNKIGNKVVVGVPSIGCGLAGGDWEVVKGILNKVLEPHKEEITLVHYYL